MTMTDKFNEEQQDLIKALFFKNFFTYITITGLKPNTEPSWTEKTKDNVTNDFKIEHKYDATMDNVSLNLKAQLCNTPNRIA